MKMNDFLSKFYEKMELKTMDSAIETSCLMILMVTQAQALKM